MGSHVTPSPEEEEEEEEQDKEERREGRKEGGTGTALARPPTAGPPPRPWKQTRVAVPTVHTYERKHTREPRPSSLRLLAYACL